MTTFDVLVRDGTVVNHDGQAVRDIAIAGGRIAAIGQLGHVKAAAVFDAKGLHVLPGVIDSQVHFREPGLTHKEDLETGSRGAVLGGVTAVFEMPNTKPLTTTKEALAAKVAAARHRMFCDFAFYVGGTRENIADVPVLERLEGCAGIKVFMGSSTGDLLVDDDASLDRIIAAISRRAAFHAEDEARLIARMGLRVPGDASSHPVWRDAEAALIATKRLVGLAEKNRRRVHVLHISTGEEMEYLSHHKTWASVEVTPHHLTLEAPECYQRLGTDHAPHTRAEKDHTYPASHSGMTGVQTLVPIMLDHVNAGRLSLARFVDLTSAGPQRIFGLATKGRIAMGYDADLTIVDLSRTETIRNAQVASRCGWTPYDGTKVKGWPVATLVRGRVVMRDGQTIGPAAGEPVKFYEAA